MALFPPELILGVLLAFVQIRLRAYCSLATWLVNGLTFFLPPEDELIATLNGHPAGAKPKAKTAAPAPQPLSAADKMQAFYIRCAKTEPGVFSQTLFFELYEMLVVLVSSALAACLAGDVLGFLTPWFASTTASDAARDAGDYRPDLAVYGLVSALLISLWFPLQLQLAQGLAGYEARLGLGMGVLGFIAAGFAILAPKGLLDFDLELAAHLAGQRAALVLTAVGFTDADLANVAPMGDMARAAAFLLLAALAGVFTSTSFLPSFRFARMYADMTRSKDTSRAQKLLLHANVLAPALLSLLWVPRLSRSLLVPAGLVKCAPRALTRDCEQAELLGLASAVEWHWYSLTEAQFEALRVLAVVLVCALRVLSFRPHLQFFLLEPREALAALVGRAGPVDGAVLQSKVRLQFNYVPVVALQLLAPCCALLSAAALLAKQTAVPLGVYAAVARAIRLWLPSLTLPASLTPEALRAASLAVLPDAEQLPELGGFKLGDDLGRQSVARLVRGMGRFPVLTPQVYAAALGFLLWFLSFSLALETLAGLVYWRYMPHGVVDDGAAVAAASARQNKQTPKTLKNQLKGLKMRKKTK